MISTRALTALALVAAFAILAPPAEAQYMYLDANANGVHDSGDHLAVTGTPTTVDVWIVTDHNRDGSLATCDVDPGSALSIESYVVNLLASGGTVSYGGFINRFTGATISFGELNPGDGRYKNGFGRGAIGALPPGTYRLCTLTITGLSGTPRVDIVDRVSGSLDFTQFASPGGCFGNDFDNVLKLTGPSGGSDWTDVDGLDPAPEVGPPVLSAIGNKTVNEGTCLTFTATAFAPNGSPVTFFLSAGAPSGASITTGGQFSWCPTEAQGPGVYTVTVCAVDNVTQLTDCETIAVTVLEVNLAPVLNPIGNKTGALGSLVTFTATATDADLPANTRTFSLDPGAPAGATIGAASGVFSWTASASGSIPVTIRVTDNGTPPLSDSETILITVCVCSNTAPVLGTIGNKAVNEGSLLSFTATATDPDVPAQTLTFSLGAGAPAGAAITAGGAFTWTPTEAQGPGVYPVTVIVTDDGVGSLSDSETIQVTVLEVNLAPVLAQIGNKTGFVLSPLTFTATATDADIPANVLTFSLDPGLPFGAAMTPGGVFSWTPATTGAFPATIRVTDNGTPPLSDSETITIVVTFGQSIPPVLEPIPNTTVDEGAVLTQTISASDPQNLPVTFTKTSGPIWMTVTTTSPTTGLITLTPDFASAGSYTATVRASNGSAVYDEKSFQILVQNVCRAPLADAGGPYAGTAGIPVAFNGTGSADPDGDALAYAWDFGDGTTGTGATPNHPYALTGTYLISLHVTDPCGLSDDDTTTATIVQCSSAYAFTTGGNSKINLGSGKQASCIQIQPVNGSFTIESVDLSSIVMRSSGTGSVEEIHAQGTKTSLSGDRNNDGTDEIAACFTKSDLQQLFSGLTGTVNVGVTLEGDLQGGGRFCTGLTLSVKAGGGGNLAASISPNPLNPSAVLTFSTQERGPVLVQLFDVRGRLLRTLRDESDAAAGYHDVRIDGTSANGSRLSSGIYFVRIRAGMEEERKTITILK
jgi:PKD domain-containing protein/putative Ig domain-containing protein